jgi:tRNA A-37 threonylcarbamoyl transferase component Bud32
MKITMKVLEGSGAGTEFVYPSSNLGEEETNILIGREDIESKAHWRLSKDDLHISRTHFMLEVRPPNCNLCDPMSLNGTYLRRKGEVERRLDEVMLQDGDILRVGHILLGIEIIPETDIRTILDEEAKPAEEVSKRAPQPRHADRKAEFMCIRCGESLDEMPSLYGENLRDLDFMCKKCRSVIEGKLRDDAKKDIREIYNCNGDDCEKDLTAHANNDGRAAEFKDVAFYLCEQCAQKMTHKFYKEHPKKIGGHTILKLLGAGGMGEVFKVRHIQTGRVAALKRMLPIAKSNERSLRRFHREISMMQALKHPNLVRLFEAGQDGNSPFFISEFVEGGDFSQFIDDDGKPKLTPPQAVQYIADALIGLEFFHQATYVHRDLKPENILIRHENGTKVPKVADFGLSKCYEKHGGSTTRAGEFAGTWMYMPPEQITDFKNSRPSVDVYAMGVTLYYILTGRSPLPKFPAPWEIKQRPGRIRLKRDPIKIILFDKRIPLARQGAALPDKLCKVIDKSIAMKAKDRFQTAEKFRRALISVY